MFILLRGKAEQEVRRQDCWSLVSLLTVTASALTKINY